jgi:hypothetical protein
MNRPHRLIIAALALTSLAASAQASIQSRWPLLAFAQEAGCELEIGGNGKFIEVRASGLIPGEGLRFTLANGDMQPVNLRAFANGKGQWQQLYIPFRFGQTGGTVTASLNASRCTMAASVPWSRGIRVID